MKNMPCPLDGKRSYWGTCTPMLKASVKANCEMHCPDNSFFHAVCTDSGWQF